jgi:hypothetical protein
VSPSLPAAFLSTCLPLGCCKTAVGACRFASSTCFLLGLLGS